MNQATTRPPLPVLVIESTGETVLDSEGARSLTSGFLAQGREIFCAPDLPVGLAGLKFGSFVTIVAPWSAVSQVSSNSVMYQTLQQINRLGLPFLVHSPHLQVGLKFQRWQAFCFYHFKTDHAAKLFNVFERLAIEVAVNTIRLGPNAEARSTFGEAAPAWSLAAPHFGFHQDFPDRKVSIETR